MSTANRFGPIVTPLDVENAVVGTIQTWIGTYLGELERLMGYEPNAIARPASIVNTVEFEKMPEDAVPAIVVMNGGIVGKPKRAERDRYEAEWRIGVAAVVSDVDKASTRALSFAYVAAIRSLILQHKSLDGFASWCTWEGEDYGGVPFSDGRNLASGHVLFSIGAEKAIIGHEGPRVPLEEPSHDPGPWPDAQRPTVIVTPKPLSATL